MVEHTSMGNLGLFHATPGTDQHVGPLRTVALPSFCADFSLSVMCFAMARLIIQVSCGGH